MSNDKYVDDERFDGLYLNVAENARGIEPLLDTVFSFLRRKTDFFEGPQGNIDGTATAIKKVNQVVEKHAKLFQEEQDRKAAAAAAKKKKKEEAEAKKLAEKAAKFDNPMQAAKFAAQKAAKGESEVVEMGKDGEFDIDFKSPAAASPPAPAPAPAAAEPTKTEEKKKEEEDDDTPGLGNGGTEPGKYVWTQTLAEVSVTVPLPDNTRGKDLSVTIARTSLKVGMKKDKGEWIINAPLTKPAIVDDSFWTVEDGNRLVINLQKSNQMEWWDSVCEGHKKIDVKKISPENSSLGDLDGETRKTVEKMMFDQRQKAMGLPTSDEQTKLDAIEGFKKAHPEMDFSNAKMNM
eukprot:CAMPEP_0113612188 /NCGR_PEP_ID=MMETSP0017_2-20120614/5966_1 /TAXON_ID=2856 /ORGANISM="Cylindrotheca closterium" /LENGTH=347 /DNA_ID=CAMNT_0000521205 /DNA_START=41 /DNA_END=1084 /DNA_ORIENTATION=+ /assembly_acc=CAM_ASM_000147